MEQGILTLEVLRNDFNILQYVLLFARISFRLLQHIELPTVILRSQLHENEALCCALCDNFPVTTKHFVMTVSYRSRNMLPYDMQSIITNTVVIYCPFISLPNGRVPADKSHL